MAAIRWTLAPVLERPTPPLVADVAAGTGKLTRGLVSAGCRVIAIDPDPAMLGVLRAAAPGVPALVGVAESLPLADASADAVVLGQAWHWVDPVVTAGEIGRVLRPGGVFGLLWNLRDESDPWVARLNSIMAPGKAQQMLTAGPPPVGPPFSALHEHTWRWLRPMTVGCIADMARSRSFYITGTAETRAAFDMELDRLLDETAAAEIQLPMVTYAYRTVLTQ